MRARYLPGVDGLRAVAVVAVLLYHAEVGWMPGGFLGVDVFFVISGYLITMLLLAEHQRTGTIHVRHFYVRRARRLLPALYALLIGAGLIAAAFYREELAELRTQALAALTYCTNWYLIASGGSYFRQLGRPLIFQHLWSLAVEEQFYLLWPIVLLVLLRRWRGRLGPIAMTLALASTTSVVWMAVLFKPSADPSRVYYGTDTRAFTLLIGALLALFWRPGALEHGTARRHGPLFDLLGLFALAGIVTFFLTAHEASRAMYHGGFLVLAMLSAVVVAAATHPAASIGRVLLGQRTLTWIGLRSYGLYLWHWPIYVMTRPHIDVPLSAGPTLVLRLGLTAVLADLSYRLVEAPIRHGGLRRWLRHVLRTDHPHRARRPVGAAIVGGAAAAMALLVTSVATAKAPVNEITQSLRAGQEAIATTDSSTPARADPTSPAVPTLTSVGPIGRTSRPLTTLVLHPTTAPTGASSTVHQTSTSSAPARPATSATTTTAPTRPTAPPKKTAVTPPRVGPIVGFGDSVMLGAAPQLLQVFGPGTLVDAKVGRTLWPIIGIARLLQAQGRLGERVVIHLGDNGGINPDLIARTMASLKDVDEVLWLTVKVPRPWEATVNATLATEIPKYPNARLLDWHRLATDPSMFYSDGIHLRPTGAHFYAELVKQAFAAT